MRVMLRAHLDTQLSNEAIKNGTLPKVMEETMARLQPEAAYFGPSEGGRCCTLIFDMQDSSQMPSIAEPFFEQFGARIELHPVMNADDLRKGLAALQ
ncbi:DUF3303 family protein [Streptomyces sp. NPDC051940]|uniref:DUF3303 family protein n=1 Tax=Streptomyces sp. NPDC051940 TaxID=3155675 RepID=UPI00342BDF35